MSDRLRRNAPLLRILHKAGPAVRRRLLHAHCTKDFINCVCECTKNIIKGNVNLTPSQKESLRRRKNTLHQLVLKKVSLKKKKKIIQSGGFLGAILGPIIGALGQFLGFGARRENS
jgi:hypothetical protein